MLRLLTAGLIALLPSAVGAATFNYHGPNDAKGFFSVETDDLAGRTFSTGDIADFSFDFFGNYVVDWFVKFSEEASPTISEWSFTSDYYQIPPFYWQRDITSSEGGQIAEILTPSQFDPVVQRYGMGSWTRAEVLPAPIPAPAFLVLAGLGAMAFVKRRRQRI